MVYSPAPASPGYLTAITNWDGQWYLRIVQQGYDVSAVTSYEQFAKAFALNQPPLFPMIIRAVMWATGLGFGAAATMVNLLVGSVTVLLLYRLIEPYAGRFVAGSAVALLCTFVSAPVLQLAYKDGLALMFIVLAMLLISRRRYWLAVLAILALSLTRQVTPPLAVVIAAHAWTRFRNRQDPPIGRAEVIAMAAVFVTSLAGLFAWVHHRPTLARVLRREQLARVAGLHRQVQLRDVWPGVQTVRTGRAWLDCGVPPDFGRARTHARRPQLGA